MGNERRCILCRTVYSTKLEMQEHMRSMLHHRELENLKGRNCDHKCWVCKVSVMGLAGYAKHISSTLHKQLVEQQAQNPNSSESEDDYFDSDLVYLVTQRDEQIRKEEEEAARRQKEDDLQKQMQWANGKEFHHSLKFSQFPKRYKVYQWQRPMCPSTSGASRGGQTHKDRAQRSSSSTGQSQQNWTTVDWGQNSQGANNCDFREYLPRRTFWKSKNNRRPRCRYSAEMDGNIDFRSDVDLPLSCSFSPQQEMYDMSYPQLFKGYKARGQKNQWGQGRGKHGWTKESRYLYSNLTYPVSSDLLPKDSSIGGSIQENDKPPSSHPASIWDQSHFSSATHCSPMFSTTGNVSSHKDYNSTGDRDWRLHQMMWKVETTLRTLPGASSSQGLTSKIAVDTSQTECNSGGQRGENFKKSLNEADRRGKVVAGVGFQAKQSLQSVQVSTSTSENPKNNVPPTSESMEKAAVREPTQEMSTDEPLDKQLDEDQDQGPSTEKCPVSDSDVVREDSETSHNPAMPNLHKLALPTLLKRDLTRHIGKAATHEPNLNIARRIRNVTKTRKGDSEKDSGLKPTLRQLISSGSRRSVNWDQVYQEVCKKKQEKGKGLPRFGIEMVTQPPSDPEGLSQEEEDFCLSEGFQWETFDLGNPSVVGPLSRKRSLSEGSICTSRAPSDISQFPNATTVTEGANETPQKICKLSSETQRTPEHDGLGLMETSEQLEAQAVNVEDANSADLRERERLCITLDSVEKSSSAAEEAAPPGISRQVRIKRERSHVDQLLSVSLREDELNTSLQTLDNNLNHARTALQAAYMEVQRLMVMKEQVTAEMTVLRSRRIRILQEMQEGYKSSPSSTKPNQEASRNTAASATLAVAQILDPFDVAGPEPVSTLSPAHAAEVPIQPCLIKEEPLSPSHENPNLAENQDACISLPMMAPPADHLVGSPKGGNQEKRKSVGQSHNLNISPPVTKISLVPEVLKDKGKDFLENYRQVISEPHEQLSSRGVNLPKASSRETVQPSLSQSGLTTPLSKQKTLKKQKKKKKMPHKVQQSRPETHNVDEQELNVQATVAYVTTSTQAPPPREMQEDTWDTVQSELKQAGDESDSSSACMEIGELPKPPLSEILSVDTDSETEKYAPSPKLCSTVVHAQNLACNEVTSTSELESKGQKENNASTSPVTFKRELKECKEESGLKEEEDNTVPTEGTFAGHTGAITAMQIHGGLLYTSSEDQTVRAFNLVTRECVALYEGHGAKVNCLFVSTIPTLPHRLYTGSSDHTVRCYRLKNTECEEEFCLLDRVLCLHSRWKVLYAGLANGCVVSFNLKTNRQMDVFECHGPRAVSCLASTQEGVRQILLVGSYDHTISVRDAKNGLLLRTLKGHNKTVICMTVVNDLVFSGSSDMSVHANNIHTGELNRIYKGHQHAVTTVAILGKVMVTACLDKLVRVYELQSHDRLQVYGGHKDMVMCMTIHKSMIYTGCYDGSLQAVKLNLMQNYRCWWHGCSLIFGVMDHLWQHLTTDHTSPRFETIKCRWKDCDAFFTTWKASVEDVSCHLKKHAEKDSQP